MGDSNKVVARIATFFISDEQCYLNFTSSALIKNVDVSGQILLVFNQYKPVSVERNIKFDLMDARGFLYVLEALARDKKYIFETKSGGNSTFKTLRVLHKDGYYRLELVHGTLLHIKIDKLKLLGLMDELRVFLDRTSNNIYVIQKNRWDKFKKKQKEQKNAQEG